jgi:ATP-dependent protease ClpP protease subunit
MQTPDWLRISNAKPGTTEVLIYDRIGRDPWDESGVSFKGFREAWNAIPQENEIALRINSPGGSIWDGLPIHNLVAERRSRVTAHVEGVAASIASVIAMGASKVVMPRQAEMFIHEPWTGAQGDAAVLRNAADRLEFLGDEIAGIYAQKSGKTKEEMRNLMKAGGIGTSFFGVAAKEAGLVDEITDEQPVQNSFDLSRFRRVPGEPTGGVQPPPVQRNNDTESPMEKTEKTPTAEVTATPTATPNPTPPANVIDVAEFNRLRDQLAAERRKRITNELNSIAAETGIDPQDWREKALADETVLASLRKLPSRGTTPVAGSVSNMGNTLIETWNKCERGAKRLAFMAANHAELFNAIRIHSPRGDNTIAATLVPGYLSDGVIDVLTDRLAMVAAYTTSFSQDPLRPRATVLVPKITVGSTTQTNPTNWESGDSTAVAVSVVVNQLGNSFHITNDQMQQGHALMDFSRASANNLANAVSDAITALMVAGTTAENGFGTQIPIDTAANFAPEDMGSIYAAARNYATTNLELDHAYLAKLIPTNRESFMLGEARAFGFDGIYTQNRWTGATANTVGFVCDKTAIAVASGLGLDLPANQFISATTTTLKNGLTVATRVWFNTATRTTWAAHDLMFGAAVGDGTAGKMLSNAAPTP